MQLSVKNFGVIREATVDLSHDCIILAGQNNTGKTYLSYLIYAFYNEIAQETARRNLLSEKSPLVLKNFVEKEIKKNLHHYFATEKQAFEQTLLQWKSDADSKALQEIKEQKIYIFPSVREGIQVFGKELSIIKNKTFDLLLARNAHARAQYSALLKFLAARFNQYPLPIQKSIEQSQNLDVIRLQTSEFGYLADRLEKDFLQGNVQINTEGDLVFQPHSKVPLAIHQTSSTVKSLSLLVVYLQHQAKKGDFILIDEPELNLHADNQLKIARFLGRLVQSGFKLLISTHSDYIIRELNTLIMLDAGLRHKKQETLSLLEKWGYDSEELLAKERLGVYLFRWNQPVESVPVTETGFDIATIDEVTERLNQISQEVYFQLLDG